MMAGKEATWVPVSGKWCRADGHGQPLEAICKVTDSGGQLRTLLHADGPSTGAQEADANRQRQRMQKSGPPRAALGQEGGREG